MQKLMVGTALRRARYALVGAAAVAGLGAAPATTNLYTDHAYSMAAVRQAFVAAMPAPKPVEVTSALAGSGSEHRHKAAQTITKMSPADQQCLAAALYYEARGEGRAGQLAVAEVVVRRAHTPGYPHSVCGVVYQGNPGGATNCQFTWACNGDMNRTRERSAWAAAQRLAQRIGTGKVALGDTTNHALFFHAVSVSPDWPGYVRTTQIGHHIFYRRRPGYRAPHVLHVAHRGDDRVVQRPRGGVLLPDGRIEAVNPAAQDHVPLNLNAPPLTPAPDSGA